LSYWFTGSNANRARNKTAIQYGSPYSNTLAPNAVDENYSTKACGGTNNPRWWSVDLGSAVNVSGITITYDSVDGNKYLLAGLHSCTCCDDHFF